MKTIWKYELPVNGLNKLFIPKGFKALSLIEQQNRVVLYCLVDPYEQKVEEFFYVLGTGQDVSDSLLDLDFLGTISTFDGMLVWHVFHDNYKDLDF